jgi:hypothetical protein
MEIWYYLQKKFIFIIKIVKNDFNFNFFFFLFFGQDITSETKVVLE